MSFPGSLQRRAMREGMAPPIKRAGGRQPKKDAYGVKEVEPPSRSQVLRDRQTRRSQAGRRTLRDRVADEQRNRASTVSNNTGRGRQRSDGQYRRLPRETPLDYDSRQARNQRALQASRSRNIARYMQEGGALPREEEQETEDYYSDEQEQIEADDDEVLDEPKPVSPPPARRASRRQARTVPAPPIAVVSTPPPPPPVVPSGLKRAFVVTPTFQSPLTAHIEMSVLDQYASVCAKDSQFTHNESPILSRRFNVVTEGDNTIDRSLLDPWMSVCDVVVLYTDLGVTPYLSEVIQWASATKKQIDFRLLGQKWVDARGNTEDVPVATAEPVPVAEPAEPTVVAPPVSTSPPTRRTRRAATVTTSATAATSTRRRTTRNTGTKKKTTKVEAKTADAVVEAETAQMETVATESDEQVPALATDEVQPKVVDN